MKNINKGLGYLAIAAIVITSIVVTKEFSYLTYLIGIFAIYFISISDSD